MEQLARYRWYLFYAKIVFVVFRNKVCENKSRIDIGPEGVEHFTYEFLLRSLHVL